MAKRHLAHEQRELVIAPRPCPSVSAASQPVRAGYRDAKAAIAAGLQGGDATSRDLAQRVVTALGSDGPLRRPDVETAAAILQLVGVPQYRATDAHARVIDLLVALGGLGFALEVFAATQGDRELVDEREARRLLPVPDRSLESYLHHRSDLVLHGHWLRLDAAGQAEARARAEALRATPELRSNSEVDRAGVFASAPTALINRRPSSGGVTDRPC